MSALSLAERIRLARRKSGLSQMNLALRCGVQRSAVANWEAPNGASPAVNNLIQLASVTSVSFEWLATGRGCMQLAPAEDMEVAAGDPLRDPHEQRLVSAFRASSARMRTNILELVEEVAQLRTGSRRNVRGSRIPSGVSAERLQ